MKRITDVLQASLLGFALTASITGLSQKKELDPQNMRAGESVEFCRTHKIQAELESNPAYLQQMAIDQQLLQNAEQNNGGARNTIYTIPVVFHVLHNGGAENISREQIMDALAILNRDYRLQNADANSVHMDFRASNPNAFVTPADVEIEFALATKAPNGQCFSGITRTQSPMSFQGDDGGDQVQAIINGNDVFNGQWPGNKYLNVFICGEIGGAAGYTTKPSNWSGTSMTNGIWILHNYVGSFGTGSPTASRALTHEVGHWLNLDHTWGGNNNPGNASSCNSDDAVSDTPNCIGLTSCNLNANTCTSNGIWGQDVRDNAENYMDYSYCSKMFTPGQVTRMRTAITSSVGGRNNIWTASNLASVGADGNAALCKADFSASLTQVCVGTQVTFTDMSYHNVQTRSWSFPGGTPATSSSANPVVIYNTPGVYQVSLTASDGSTSDDEVKVGYITVLPEGVTLPIYEGFEAYNETAQVPFTSVSNLNNAKWELTTTVGQTGTKSMKLNNFGQSGANIDEMISAPMDLSNVTSSTGMTLSFRYAYRKRSSANAEVLKVMISNDCGESWVQRRTISGTALGTEVVTSSWEPTTSDWVTVHMTNVTSSYWVDNFMYKFVFEGNGGNNVYIDNINIYTGDPSELSIEEAANSIQNAAIYPNPADDQINVAFNVPTSQKMKVQIIDLTGKIVETKEIQALSGDNLVLLSTDHIAKGMYQVKLGNETINHVMQVVIR